jgi:hypothetical protein
MGADPLEAGREIRVPSREREVAIGTFSAGETWSFSAAGEWSTGFVHCGPGGYRNFLFDALEFTARAPGEARLKLMCKFRDEPDPAAFPIGAGCTRTFARSGELVVFAKDRPEGYADNRGHVTLTAVRGGGAAGPANAVGGLDAWGRFRDVFSRTKGIPVIAALVLGVSWILVFMQQGQDLVRGIGEDNFWQYPTGFLQIAFALGLLFLALQAWGWSRLVINSNYGEDRRQWRPAWLLVWGPRVLGALPFAAAAIALIMNPARNTGFVVALIVLGAIFFIFVIRRQDIQRGLSARRAGADPFPHAQRYSVIASLILAIAAMVVATLWPTRFRALLGAPAVVFLGLGLIIPLIVIAIQLGAGLRIPVAGTLLALAVVFGLWVDNHRVGRRAVGVATTGPTDRLSLAQAYGQWSAAQPGGADARKTMILIAVQGGASRAGYWTAVALSNLREAAKAKGVDGGYFDTAGAETLREMVRALHAIRAEARENDPLDIVFVLIGYRNPDASTPTPALAVNDVFAPLFGLFASMSAHESHLAREMKLTGQPKVEAADPYVSRMTGGDFDYAALALCKGKIDAGGQLKDYDPPMDWTLSGEAKRYIENSVIATTPACNAKANVETIDAIVDRLRR